MHSKNKPLLILQEAIVGGSKALSDWQVNLSVLNPEGKTQHTAVREEVQRKEKTTEGGSK